MASSKKKSSTAAKHTSKAAKTSKKETPTPEIVKEVVADAKQKISAQQKTPEAFTTLQRRNKWLAVIYAFQAIAILVLGVNYVLPVTTTFLTQNPLAGEASKVAGAQHLFDISVPAMVALFFFVAAIIHGVLATVCRKRYERELSQSVNRLRWIEYAVAGSIMLMLVGMLSGVSDLSLLLLIGVSSTLMCLLYLTAELARDAKASIRKLLFWLGTVAGIAPLLAIATYAIGAAVLGSGSLPGYVLGIYASMFVLWGAFVANVFLQHAGKGKWTTYVHAEQMYMLVSLVAKTLLGWQIFMGILRP